jgi:hypothetical protein
MCGESIQQPCPHELTGALLIIRTISMTTSISLSRAHRLEIGKSIAISSFEPEYSCKFLPTFIWYGCPSANCNYPIGDPVQPNRAPEPLPVRFTDECSVFTVQLVFTIYIIMYKCIYELLTDYMPSCQHRSVADSSSHKFIYHNRLISTTQRSKGLKI